jgi:hypothetical protein
MNIGIIFLIIVICLVSVVIGFISTLAIATPAVVLQTEKPEPAYKALQKIGLDDIFKRDKKKKKDKCNWKDYYCVDGTLKRCTNGKVVEKVGCESNICDPNDNTRCMPSVPLPVVGTTRISGGYITFNDNGNKMYMYHTKKENIDSYELKITNDKSKATIFEVKEIPDYYKNYYTIINGRKYWLVIIGWGGGWVNARLGLHTSEPDSNAWFQEVNTGALCYSYRDINRFNSTFEQTPSKPAFYGQSRCLATVNEQFTEDSILTIGQHKPNFRVEFERI